MNKKTEWGLRKYKKVQNFYNKFFELRESGYSFDQVCGSFNIKFIYDSINSTRRIRDTIINQQSNKYKSSFIEDIQNCTDLDSLFSIFQKHSYNLCKTVTEISDLVFNNLKLPDIEDKDLKTAILCAALVDLELVRSDRCFKNFE